MDNEQDDLGHTDDDAPPPQQGRGGLFTLHHATPPSSDSDEPPADDDAAGVTPTDLADAQDAPAQDVLPGQSPQPDGDACPPVALITGGQSSVSAAIAGELARRGWAIFLQFSPAAGGVQQQQQAERAIMAAARGAGKEVQVASASLSMTDSGAREQLVEQVLDTFDRIDMLVNACAIAHDFADLLEVSEGQLRAAMESTLFAPFFLGQRVAQEMVRMVESGQIESPRIVTITSSQAFSTGNPATCLAMAQAALSTSIEVQAARLGEYGIRVYEVRSSAASGPDESGHARFDGPPAENTAPIRRRGRAGDVAKAVAAIAEDMLAFSTGQVINVDGGLHIRRG